ncbi:MAG: DUF2079 domain-containing protein [Candidatus Omnitrophica bacterium]|jgi:hypothetical protein|nr:DUF2079 domain-containing protein [Candidatus Omnitrophota bacterium]
MIAFLFSNIVVLTCAVVLSKNILRITNALECGIASFILYSAQIVFTEILLGVFERLTFSNLILVHSGILVLVLACARQKNKRISRIDFPLNKLERFICASIISFLLVKMAVVLLNPPMGWDAINYHLTFPVQWLKNANLNIPVVVGDDPSPTYYPINASLYYFWLILPFKSVFLADAGQFPFWLLSVLLVYKIIRFFKADREVSFYGACLFAVIPNLFRQISIAYVDLMVAGLFLSGLYYLFVLSKEFSFKNTILFAISAGLMIGVKTIALPYAFLLALPYGYICLRNLKKIYLPVIAIGLIFIFGAFSYLRNFIETGNPFYPLNFSLFGKAVFPGVMDMAVYRAHFTSSAYSLKKILFGEGLGLQTVIFILPVVFLAPVFLLFKEKNKNFILGFFSVMPLLFWFVYRYYIPLANLRYLYAFFGISMAWAFYIIWQLKVPIKIIRWAVFVCFLCSFPEMAKKIELVISLVLAAVLFFASFRLRLKKSHYPLILVFILLSLVFAQKYHQKNEFARYRKMVKSSGFWPDATEAWEWLNQNTKTDNIAYTGRPVPFPLYGANFKNNVFYVSVNKIDPVKLHYFPESSYKWGIDFMDMHLSFQQPNNYRGMASYADWLGNLKRRGAGYLFVYSLHQTKQLVFPIEDQWAKAHPENFTLVFDNRETRIYKLNI